MGIWRRCGQAKHIVDALDEQAAWRDLEHFPSEGCPALQVVVLDKLDYCASLHNLDTVMDCPNFKVRSGRPLFGVPYYMARPRTFSRPFRKRLS